MKKLLFALIALIPLTASAQKNPDIMVTDLRTAPQRREVTLPETLNGYNIYKADLHIHTIYSDGHCTPDFRVQEAYYDGLDILAITDHIEYRRIEKKMMQFLKGYHDGKVMKHENDNVIKEAASERGILADLNFSIKEAEKAAEKWGILIIPAGEITREPVEIGHYNALFTKDVNKIYDPDPLQSLRNARKQGALIMHNHPGWRRTSCDKTEFEKQAYAEGLIDGIEVVNGSQCYPKMVQRAQEDGLFIASSTDHHTPTTDRYLAYGQIRNMTFILAEKCTLKSIREALEARRTLAYTAGYVLGEEQLLKDFFKASVKFRVISFDEKKGWTVEYRNTTSIPFKVSRGGVIHTISPFQTLNMVLGPKSNNANLRVNSMLFDAKKTPVVEFSIK